MFRYIPIDPSRLHHAVVSANCKHPYMHENAWWLVYRGSGICAAPFEVNTFQSNDLNMSTNSIENGKSKARLSPIGLSYHVLSKRFSSGGLPCCCLTSTPQVP